MRFILSMAITGSIGMGLGAVLIFFPKKVAVSYRYFCFCGMSLLYLKDFFMS